MEEMPPDYNKNIVPLFDGIPFYLFSGVKSAIQTKSVIDNIQTRDRTKSWRLLVRQCLIEVYGKYLTQFSAKGMKEAHRPAIDNDLYKGLLYWAREWSEDEIDEDDYVILINKTAYNKRKAEIQRNKKENEKKNRTASIQRNEEIEKENQGVENENEKREDKRSETLKKSGEIAKEKNKDPCESEKAAISVSNDRGSLPPSNTNNREHFGNTNNHQHYENSWSSWTPANFPQYGNFLPTNSYPNTYYENPYVSVPYQGNLNTPEQNIPHTQTSSENRYHEM